MVEEWESIFVDNADGFVDLADGFLILTNLLI